MENEEKRYTITRIEKIDSQISEAKKRVAAVSIFVGTQALLTAWFIIDAYALDSTLELISGITMGTLGIYSAADLKREFNDLKKLKELRAKILEEGNEEIRKVK